MLGLFRGIRDIRDTRVLGILVILGLDRSGAC